MKIRKIMRIDNEIVLIAWLFFSVTNVSMLTHKISINIWTTNEWKEQLFLGKFCYGNRVCRIVCFSVPFLPFLRPLVCALLKFGRALQYGRVTKLSKLNPVFWKPWTVSESVHKRTSGSLKKRPIWTGSENVQVF